MVLGQNFRQGSGLDLSLSVSGEAVFDFYSPQGIDRGIRCIEPVQNFVDQGYLLQRRELFAVRQRW